MQLTMEEIRQLPGFTITKEDYGDILVYRNNHVAPLSGLASRILEEMQYGLMSEFVAEHDRRLKLEGRKQVTLNPYNLGWHRNYYGIFFHIPSGMWFINQWQGPKDGHFLKKLPKRHRPTIAWQCKR